ncbi:MAG: Fic family protein [Candidatus Hydrothermarchaeales archaeon]
MADTDINVVLLERIEKKKEQLDARRPLPKDALKRLQEEFRLHHTYHSNAIEGNTLTLSETKLVIEEGITVGGKSLKEYLEARNTSMAYDLIEGLAKEKEISHTILQQIHEAVTIGLIEDTGKYRTKNVRITGAIKTPPGFTKVPGHIEDLLEDLKKIEAHPLQKAAYLHHRFVEIHPFIDGNGRVARLLTNLFLIRNGYPPIVLRKEDRAKYYRCLRSADGGNLKPFANFIARASDESLMKYLSIFGGEDELLPLKVLTKETPYSQEYLSLRARQGALDGAKINRTWHSTKRALKEYIRRVSG